MIFFTKKKKNFFTKKDFLKKKENKTIQYCMTNSVVCFLNSLLLLYKEEKSFKG